MAVMAMETDYGTDLAPSRRGRLVPIIAVIVPIVIFVGAAAWFIRAYVAPPMVNIGEPPLLASVEARFAPAPTPSPEASAAVQAASVRPSPMVASLSFVPPSRAPAWPSVEQQPTQAFAPQPDAPVAAGEPIAGPIPLPQPRPRFSLAVVRGPAPLPRPRPVN